MSLDFENIYQELAIPDNEETTEEQLLEMITNRVAYYLDVDKGLLLSYLYRLDIDERKIEKTLLETEEHASVAIARLILERQKQRIETKKKYKQEPIEDWDF